MNAFCGFPTTLSIDPYENHLRAFQLIGTRYKAISLPENRLWLEELDTRIGFLARHLSADNRFVVALV